jgi:flagellar hook assembly protein FlgD
MVSLKVYDITGKLVKTLVNDKKDAGYHSVVWHGKDETGKSVSSGIYIYKLTTNDGFTETKRMTLLR